MFRLWTWMNPTLNQIFSTKSDHFFICEIFTVINYQTFETFCSDLVSYEAIQTFRIIFYANSIQ
jgi:hypothetical protein